MDNPFDCRAKGGYLGSVDLIEVRRALALLVDPDHSVELRALPSGRSRNHLGGDLDGLVASAVELGDEKGLYFGLNPNSIAPGSNRAAKKADVIRRRWLLIDCDPVRPRDLNASDEEKALAHEKTSLIRHWLSGQGWPLPLCVDSGNGSHLLYRVDLPADEDTRTLLKSVLFGLSSRFSSPSVEIDKAVHDAPRISKLPGTWARKGPMSDDRPHRLAKLISVPSDIGIVTIDQLRLIVPEDSADTVIDFPSSQVNGHNPFSRPATSAEDAYAQAALRSELAAILGAPVGSRNNQLNTSSFNIGQFVGANRLDESAVIHQLLSASLAIGLTEAEANLTIRSGLEAGKTQPRFAVESPRSSEPTSYSADDVCTIDDLIRAGSEVSWVWPGWIPCGVLTVLASEPGTGKTRFCADLLRRIRYGLPWPDGAEQTLPAGSLALWVMSDNHHDEMVNLSQAFGIKDSIRINASKSDPFGGVTLDDAAELCNLEGRIKAVKPILVIVDTVGNATDKNLSKQEDAKAFYQPLQVIARKHRVAIICATHLNAAGAVLGRRALEKVRLAIKMERPSPEAEPNRRRLQVVKSNSKYPSVLGVTMGDHGNDYDTNPPSPGGEPGRSKPGPNAARLQECSEWLNDYLSDGPKRVSITRNAAESAGFDSKLLYRARDILCIHEYELQGKKWWTLTKSAFEDS
jgi:hypothetical protein